MTYHPGLKQINYAPVAEMDKLHGKTLSSLTNVKVDTTTPASLTVSASCDIQMTFAVPAAAATIKVRVGSTGGSFLFDYTPAPKDVAESVDQKDGTGDPWSVNVGFGKSTDSLLLLPDDKSLTLRIFLDGPIAEGYWMGGRVAMTVDSPATTTAEVSSTSPVTLTSAIVYSMGDIHSTVEDVLAAPRLG